MDLVDAMATLAHLRRNLDRVGDDVKAHAERVSKLPEAVLLQKARECQATLAKDIADLEKRIRAEAVAGYNETGTKNPAPGVTIKLYDSPCYDTAELLGWCQQNRPGYILKTLDVKRVAKAADDMMRDGAPMHVVEEPRATIATDLSDYLPASKPAPAAEEPPF